MDRRAQAKRIAFLVALGFVLNSILLSQGVSAALVTKRIKSDSADADLIASCDQGPFKSDYKAQTASGVPLNGPYAVARGADKGLVFLMNAGGRRAKTFVVPHRTIRAIVSIKYDETLPDRVDLVFTARNLDVIHTFSTNAGIFVVSNVYEFRYAGGRGVNTGLLAGDPDVLKLLDLRLKFYTRTTRTCVP